MINISLILEAVAETEKGNFFEQLWTKVTDFFVNYGVDITIRMALAFALIFGGHYLIKLIIMVMNKIFHRKHRKKEFELDHSVISFILSFTKFVLNVFLAFLVIYVINIPLNSFFSILSAAVLAIGLSLQDVISNFSNGVVILSSSYFKTGDYIFIGKEIEGEVVEINMMTTVLKSIENKRIIVPNSVITKSTITNVTAADSRRVTIDLNVAYNTDINKAKELIMGLLLKEPYKIATLEPSVYLTTFKDSSIILSARVWVRNENYWDAYFSLNEKLLALLKENKIEIPFPQVSVHVDDNK